jgi:hypothetical protein
MGAGWSPADVGLSSDPFAAAAHQGEAAVRREALGSASGDALLATPASSSEEREVILAPAQRLFSPACLRLTILVLHRGRIS